MVLLDRLTSVDTPIGHFLFISHELHGRKHSYSVYKPDQLTLTSSHSRNKKPQALLTFYCGGSYLQEASVISFVHEGRQIKILTECLGIL